MSRIPFKSLVRNPYLCVFLFLGGVFLLGLNVYGRIHPLRNPDIYHARYNLFTNDITLTEAQFYTTIQRHGESDEEYMIKATDAVNRGLAHYSQGGVNVPKYYYLPLSENYLLWLSRYATLAWKIPLGYKEQDVLWYRFASWRKTVERGVGLCGAHAQVLMEVLKLNHIPVRVVYVPRHVLVEASPDRGKTWWTLDADYGAVIPETVNALRADPETIARYYKAKGYDPTTLKLLQTVICEGTTEFKYSSMDMHGRGKFLFEYASYYLIWVMPIVLMLPLLADFFLISRRIPARLTTTFSLVDQKPSPLCPAAAAERQPFHGDHSARPPQR